MSFKNLLKSAAAIVLLLISQLVMAQERVVSGRVIDSKTNAGVPAVTITVKGSKTGTQTASDGSFRISVAPDVTTLIFSSIGYATQEVDITGKSSIEVPFVINNAQLGEVVVTGYGTARKRDLTGSIVSVKEKDFNKGVNTSPDQLIQGKVAGLQVTNNNGQPGASSTIRIRGTGSVRSGNAPLIVVDGVPLEGGSGRPGLGLPGMGGVPGSNPLNFINPADIESMDVLKDASASAIYGSRGANGVILITTKKGRTGITPVIEFGYAFGVSKMANQIELLSGSEYVSALTKYGLPATVSTTAVPTGNYGANVDAMDAILKTGTTHNLNLALSGGSETARQRVSISYLNEEGIVEESQLKKYTVGYTGNFKFLESKKLGLDVNLNTAFIQEEIVPITNNAGFQGSLIGQALQWNPTHPFTKTDGSFWIEPQFGASSVNPLWMLQMYDDNVNTTQVWGYIAPYYRFTNELEYKFQYGRNQSNGRRTAMMGRELLNFTDIKNRGWASSSEAKNLVEQYTHTLSYSKQINPNFKLDAVIGYEYLNFENSNSGQTAQDFTDIGIPYYNMFGYSTVSSRNMWHYESPTNELQSMFARANVNFRNKYLLTATVRRDGSTKFGENNQYATFPSFSAAWVIGNEDFMQNMDFIQNLKIRAGFGQTGNQEFPSGASQTRYGVSGPGSISQLNVGNPDLRWETSTNFNVGLDFQLLKGRINVTADYFNKETEDVLFELDFPQPGASSAKQWKNLDALVTNTGVELAVNASIIKKADFTWDLNVNGTWLENMLEGLNGTYNTGALSGQGSSGAYIQKLASGYPLNVFYLRDYQGIDKTTGQASYAQDGDVSFYGEDPNPNFLFGAGTELNYKKFTFTVNFNGAFGHYLYNETAMNVIPITNLGTRNVASSFINSDTREDLSNPITSSTRFLEKGNYIKCQNARIAYSFGTLGKYFRNATVALTGQNLFTITDYTGFDPEVNVDKNIGGIPSVGIEYIPFPSSRRFQISINFSL